MSRSLRTFRVSARLRGNAWSLRIRPPTGSGQEREVPIQAASPEDAQAQAQALAASLNAKLAAEVSREDPRTVLEVLDRHIEWRQQGHERSRGAEGDSALRGLAGNTVRSFQTARAALADALGGLLVGELDRTAVVRVQERLGARLKHSTANLYVQRLGSAWDWAHERGLVAAPFPRWRRLPTERTAHRDPTPEEAERLLAAAREFQGGRYLPPLLLLAEQGARAGEVLGLRGRDVSRSTGAVTYRITKTREARTVELSREVMALLPEAGPDEPVFRAARGRGAMPYDSLRGAWVVIRRMAGLEGEPLVLHSWRAYVIRKLHEANTPLRESMAVVGHKSVQTHMNYLAGRQTPGQRERLRAAHGEMLAGVAKAARDCPGARDSGAGWASPGRELQAAGIPARSAARAAQPEPAPALLPGPARDSARGGRRRGASGKRVAEAAFAIPEAARRLGELWAVATDEHRQALLQLAQPEGEGLRRGIMALASEAGLTTEATSSTAKAGKRARMG